jgi:hypothetical protein
VVGGGYARTYTILYCLIDTQDNDVEMKARDISVQLLNNTDWKLTFDHAALEDTVVALAPLPDEQRSGIARKLLAASATYCLASTMLLCLSQKGIMPHGISAEATINMYPIQGEESMIDSLDLNVIVTVPKERWNDLDHCRILLEEGSLVTKSLEKSITVNHTITMKRAND